MSQCLVIAEAGVNHNGSAELALKLIDAAADAGADYVKFQTFKAEALVSEQAKLARYQQDNIGTEKSQYAMLRTLELTEDVYPKLIARCEQRGIGFMSTPFDLASVDFLVSLEMGIFKIPSGEITNLPYLRKVGSLGRRIILSTGMSTLAEVAAALDVLQAAGTPASSITLLHCTTEYPAPFHEINLRAMKTLERTFGGVAGVGYSDHTQGLAISFAAVAMGAVVIEKHFTLSRSLEGPDHKASLEPQELAEMVEGIHAIGLAQGDGIKRPSMSEANNLKVVRKSLVAACRIHKGEVFTPDNVAAKRPGTGISPMLWDDVIGTRAEQDYEKDDLL